MLRNLIAQARAPQQILSLLAPHARLVTKLSKTMAWAAPVINYDYNPLQFILEA